jgi:hypothetical protein
MRWSLVPFWAKDIEVGFANINEPKSGSWLGVRCVRWNWTTGDCGSGGVESNGRFELAAVQVMSQCFTEDAVPPPERVQLLRTLAQSGHEAGDTQICPACQVLLAVRAADRQRHLAGMVGSPRQGGE